MLTIKLKYLEKPAWNEKLAQARKSKGLSQAELAIEVEAEQQSVSRWERGVAYPAFDRLLMIAKALDISLDWLIDPAREESLEDERLTRQLLRSVGTKAASRLLGLPDSANNPEQEQAKK